MATLASAGVGSGLDVNGIVTQLMTVEKQPLTLLTKQQNSYKAQISAIGQIQAMLSSFQTAVKTLSSASASPAYKASSGDSSVFSASASGSAVAGSYAINVTQLAQSQKLVAGGVADKTAAIGAGTATTLSFDFGTISGGSFDSNSGTYSGASFSPNAAKTPFTVQIDNTNNTLQGIRDAINAKNAGVSASIVNDGSGTPYRLVLTSTDSGAANSLRIGVSGDASIGNLLAYDPAGTQNLAQQQAAQNANLTVDGIAITSASNSVTDAVQGVTLNLSSKSTGAVPLTVSRDAAPLANAINALVTAYNNAEQAITTTTAQGATLQGDSNILGIERQLRTTLGSIISTSGAYKSLSAINVAFQKDGTLQVDSAKLQSLLSSNYGDVATLTNSIATSLTTQTGNILDTSNGQLVNETNGINDAIKDNQKQQDDFNARLVSIEARYRAQFQALDTLMSKMNQTSSFLTQQFYKTNSSSNG